MGGTTFMATGVGTNANEAFTRARDDAAYEHGHGGYTGTIAEKGGFRSFPLHPLPDGATPSDLANACLNCFDDEDKPVVLRRPQGRYDSATHQYVTDGEPILLPDALRPTVASISAAVDDKWGDAGCFDITDTDQGRDALGRSSLQRAQTAGQRVYLFFGWASC